MSAELLDWVLNGARKATGAFVLGLVGALATAMSNGVLTGTETVAAIGTGLAAAVAVFSLANKGDHAPDAGGDHRLGKPIED